MGSMEEEQRFIDMVTGFIESSDPSSCFCHSPLRTDSFNHNLTTLKEIIECVTDDENEVLGQVLKCLQKEGSSGDTATQRDLNKLIVTQLKREHYQASLCKTSWITNAGFNKTLSKKKVGFNTNSSKKVAGCSTGLVGEYEYIDVMMKNNSDGGEPTRVIVDIDFRSQFELARPTEAYRGLLAALPLTFVGSEEKLHRVISLLCSAAKQSLRESGLHVPPWRRASYVQSKWLFDPCTVSEWTINKDSEWAPDPVVSEETHRQRMGVGGGTGGSGLPNRFSNLGINCC